MDLPIFPHLLCEKLLRSQQETGLSRHTIICSGRSDVKTDILEEICKAYSLRAKQVCHYRLIHKKTGKPRLFYLPPSSRDVEKISQEYPARMIFPDIIFLKFWFFTFYCTIMQ